ncbi:WD40 repeat domain-containing protein [Streptomyces sp. NPDC004629]|uniref:WD40 repeat domain-containing protein n=1 Tax=Streptomyces sp. NPDC004629 TaxID=3364705 RepID=UPI0036B27210
MSPSDTAVVVDVLLGQVRCAAGGVRAWSDAEPYLLRHIVQHAVEDDRLDELLTDPEFLVYADPATLIPELTRAKSRTAVLLATVYRAAIKDLGPTDASTRRQILALNSARFGAGAMAERFNNPPDGPPPVLRPTFSTGSDLKPALRVALRHDNDFHVYSLATAVVDGRQVLLSTGTDQKGDKAVIRVRDIRTGEHVMPPMTAGAGAGGSAIAVSELAGKPVMVTLHSGQVWVWSLHTGEVLLRHVTQAVNRRLACATLDGRPVFAVGEGDSAIVVRDLETGRLVRTHTPRPAFVSSLQVGELGDRPVLVCGYHDGVCLVLDLRTGGFIGPEFGGHQSDVVGTVGRLDGRPVVVTASQVHQVGGTRHPGVIMVRDPFTAELRARPVEHPEGVHALACTSIDGKDYVVVGGGFGDVTVRDLRTGEAVQEPIQFEPATGSANDILCTRIDDRPVVVACAHQDTVWVADLWPAGTRIGDPVPGHEIGVESIAITETGGRHLVLSGGHLGDIHKHDAYTGRPYGPSMAHGRLRITSFAFTRLNGRDIAITGSPRESIGLHDLATGRFLGSLRGGGEADRAWAYSVSCLPSQDRQIIISTHWENQARVWDLWTCRLLREFSFEGSVSGASPCALTVDGRPILATVVTDDDRETRRIVLHDIATGSPTGQVLTGYDGWSSANYLATLDHADTPVVVCAGNGGNLRAWDARTGKHVMSPQHAQGFVSALAAGVVDGRPIVVTGTQDGVLRVYDLAGGTVLGQTLLPGGWIKCLAVHPRGLLAVGYRREVAAFDLSRLTWVGSR